VADEQSSKSRAKGALDLSQVWARGVALLRDNAQLIAILAAVFVMLPNAALQFALPSDGEMDAPLKALLDPNASQAMQERAAQTLGELLQPFILSAGVALVISHMGYAGMVALIGRARPTVGEALMQAARVVLPLMLALIITFMAIYAALLVVQLILTPLGPEVAAFLGAILGVLAMFYCTARLAVTLPVMVIEWELNPLKALIRSWRLTASHSSQVFGFWMIMAVAWFVTLLIQGLIATLLSSVFGAGSTAALVQGLIGGLFAMVWGAIYCAMGVSMHTQLKGPDAEDIASEFD